MIHGRWNLQLIFFSGEWTKHIETEMSCWWKFHHNGCTKSCHFDDWCCQWQNLVKMMTFPFQWLMPNPSNSTANALWLNLIYANPLLRFTSDLNQTRFVWSMSNELVSCFHSELRNWQQIISTRAPNTAWSPDTSGPRASAGLLMPEAI